MMEKIHLRQQEITLDLHILWSLFWLVLYEFLKFPLPIPVAAQTKAVVCSHSLAGIAGLNAAGGMDVCPLLVLHVVRVLCYEMKACLEESYWVWCLDVIVKHVPLVGGHCEK
jgi:hypothetical protein